jgi:hypothetical protein
MTSDDKIKSYVEMWKQTIAVQQHFNDICWRIRGLALTALTFSLGAAAVAARETLETRLFGFELRLATVLAIVGLVLWLVFYFVDQIWYHRLLVGAVKHGQTLEDVLRAEFPKAGLTYEISNSSPYTVEVLGKKVAVLHSRTKLKIFYFAVAVLLALFAVALQVGGPASAEHATSINPSPSATTPSSGPPTRSPRAPPVSASPTLARTQ